MRKPLILAALVVGAAALARKRSNAKAADAALWHEATTSATNGSTTGARNDSRPSGT